MNEWLKSSDWYEWVFLAVLLLVGYILWTLLSTVMPDGSGSPVVQLAFSLASGRGYALPGNQLAAFNLPPLYPFMLAGFTKLLTNRHVFSHLHTAMAPYQMLNFCLYVASTCQLYLMSRRMLPSPWGCVVPALYAISPTVLMKTAEPSGDLAFVVFSLLALQTIEQFYTEMDLPVSGWNRVWCCVWMAAAILTRTVGFVLPLTYLVMMIRRREFQAGLITVVLLVLAIMPWTFTEVYYRNLNQVPSDAQAIQTPTLPTNLTEARHFIRQVAINAENGMVRSSQGMLGNFSLSRFDAALFRKLQINRLNVPISRIPIVHWLLALVLTAGIYLGLQEWPGLPSVYLLCFFVVTTLFPSNANQLLMPILPILLLHLFLGVMQISLWVGRFGFQLDRYLLPLLTLLIVVNDINGHLDNVHNAHNAQSLQLVAQSQAPPQEQAVHRLAAWVRTNTSIQSRIMSQSHDLSWFAGRKLIAFPPTGDTSDHQMQAIMRVDYILDEPNHPAHTMLSQLQQTYPANFKVLYKDIAANLTFWEVIH